jgi:type 1 glutamine amidotransferase
MKNLFRSVCALAVLAAATSAMAEGEWGLSGGMENNIANVQKNKDMMAKIEKAIPAEAPVKIEKPRQLLVFVRVAGYYHDSIPVAAIALKKMGEKTGAWNATVTDDVKVFSKENLAKFDGIFMVNTVGEHPSSKEGKEAFVEFLKGGKGLMGTHAAADCNHPWPEYQDMIGGEFAGHPFFQIGVKNEDPDHPINAAFGGKGFGWDDEMYVYKTTDAKRPEGFSREKQRVLLSFNAENTKQWEGMKGKHPRPDGDYPISWIKTYGEGRVFYCSMGHNQRDFWNPILLKHYLAGCQYALGDLKADATPSAKLPADRKMGEAPKWDDKSQQIFDVK